MNELVNAEYRIVQERTLSVIVSEILTIEQNVAKVAMDGMIQIGKRLHEAKKQIDHGEWEEWCTNNLNYSKSQAARFMQIADKYGNKESVFSNLATSQDLSIGKALKLLQIPEEDVEEFVDKHPVDEMTLKELSAEVERLKEEKSKAEIEVEQTKKDMAGMQKKIDAALVNVDKKKSEIQKLKAKAEEDKEKAEKEIQARIEESNRKAREQALAESGVPQLEEKIESLERKLANSADETKMKFKIKVDQLQETWEDCLVISDEDDSGKMKEALGVIIDNMRGEI